jgi:hypothetical protein
MVKAPARTGRDKINKNTVIKTLQTNKPILSKVIDLLRILKIVQIKLILPKIELIPAK